LISRLTIHRYPEQRHLAQYSSMDYSVESLQAYIGKPAAQLPSPSLVLSEHVVKRNTSRLLQDVQDAGIDFRAHVKTLKVSIRGCVA